MEDPDEDKEVETRPTKSVTNEITVHVRDDGLCVYGTPIPIDILDVLSNRSLHESRKWTLTAWPTAEPFETA